MKIKIWYDKYGNGTLISKMEEQYIKNCIKYIENSRPDHVKIGKNCRSIKKDLKQELKLRNTPLYRKLEGLD